MSRGVGSVWPDFIMPPINLWALPKQYRDFMQNNKPEHVAERRKSNSLKLVPTKRPSARSRIIIEPVRGVGHSMQTEQILINIARRNK